jgi:hypothetical protein
VRSAKTREIGTAALVLGWLIFTVTFATWWLILSLDHVSRLAELEPAALAHWTKQRHMIQLEGSAWIVLLVIGGGALMILTQRERSRVRRIREFFASFSHEVKTSLASLRLQTEALQDDLAGEGRVSPVLDRLVGDTVRLQLQLENSLFLASQDNLELFTERVRLTDLAQRMREQWPSVSLPCPEECMLFGDQRALRTIFSNLVQNALVHGGASEVRLEAKPRSAGQMAIAFVDNGAGFEGKVPVLGQLFHRPKATSGSGLGLYICRLLARRMGGDVELHAANHGFRVDLILRGEPR